MLKSLLAIMVVLSIASASSAQQSAKTGQQTKQANPCDAANTQMDMNQCSADEYKKADAHLSVVYTHLIRLLQKDSAMPSKKSGGEQRKLETPAVDKLKAAQRQWIRYRDLQHGYETGDAKLE